MRTRQTALRMIVLSFLLVGCMCIFAACAKSEKKASAAGVYHLYSMESDGDSYSHDDIVSYGLDSMALTLYADGTASLGFGEETEQFQWKEGMLYSDDCFYRGKWNAHRINGYRKHGFRAGERCTGEDGSPEPGRNNRHPDRRYGSVRNGFSAAVDTSSPD